MDISPYGLFRNWLPHLPSIVATGALSLVGQASNSEHQDALTQIIVKSARPILQTPAPLLKSQLNCNHDYGFGRAWISKYTITKIPEEGVSDVSSLVETFSAPVTIQEAVISAFRYLQPTHQPDLFCPIPDLVPVETEWTFYRPHTLAVSPVPDVSERELYSRYMKSANSEGPTILHLHGGAFCLMDPATHRWTCSSLAQHADGRVLSVRYRLSPQHVFPAALIDAFTAYLALICPPPNSYHSPVAAEKIVLSGDSSGGNLAASLALLLLTLSHQHAIIKFHGNAVVIPDPPFAGTALASPWLDITRSLPSTTHNARWDIIAPPPFDSATPPFPPDAIWPTSPPRAETYCPAVLTTHPLVSPVAARPHHWKGLPPIHLICGWEGFTDEIEVLARRIFSSSSNATVHFEGYEGMPHCFMMIPWNQAGHQALKNWARFCTDVTTPATPPSIPDETPSSSITSYSPSRPEPEYGSNRVRRTESAIWFRSCGSSSSSSSNSIKNPDPTDPQHAQVLLPFRRIPLAQLDLLNTGSGYSRTTTMTMTAAAAMNPPYALDDMTVDAMMEKGRRWRMDLEREMVDEWRRRGNDTLMK